MHNLKSGVFYIHEQQFEECDWHQTRLSLNFNFDHRQTYSVGSREHTITPDKYLLINEGQWFKTRANFSSASRMLTIAYKVGLAEELSYSLSKSEEYLLDNPVINTSRLFLFDRTCTMNTTVHRAASVLCDKNLNWEEEQMQDYIENILSDVLHDQLTIQKDVHRINKVKLSTRQEIFKRLTWAREYIDENFTRDLTIHHLAKYACLSPFHFKRQFRQAFHQPPYQYIKIKRLERARALLQSGHSVTEVCELVGWKDVSSFIRLFRKLHSTTPGKFQNCSRLP
jgi:AraC family transcriptional regulator